MIFDELMLHDFGIYAGQQTIKLTPSSPQKPVIMFYGLNGCGKTTILEALQIALFGHQAPFLEGQNFNQYMSQRINNRSQHGQASLRLDFHRHENGQLVQYRIYRIWKKTLSGLKESLEVIKDGRKNNLLSSRWDEYVEEIISARLAHFFFFDGEKIEEYASEAGAQQLISMGLQRLLGLDLITKSTQDLATLRRRKLSQNIDKNADDGLKQEISQKQEDLAQLEREKDKLVTEKARIQTHEIDKYQREVDALDIQYKALGKDLWERREEIKTALFEKRAEKSGNDVVVREIISGALPLFLVQDYFAEIEQHKKDLESKKIDALRLSILEDIEREISKFLKNAKTDSELAKKLSGHIKTKKQSLTTQDSSGALAVEGRDFDSFDRETLENEIKEAVGSLDKAIKAGHLIDEQVDDLATEEGSIPDSGEVKELTEKQTEINGILTKAKISLEKVNDDLNLARGRIEKAEKEIDSLSQQALEMNIEGDRQGKYLSRLDSANAILQTFSQKIVKSKVEHIEQLILESYEALLRKENLLKSISISPETLHLSLDLMDGTVLANNQLSAGERQLLSISILWGLAKASSKPFPMAVDTPFGRLDSVHRSKLVSNYFIHASHQIMLFSTDEEIVGDYFDAISPNVSWIYRLNYDNEHGITKIEVEQ